MIEIVEQDEVYYVRFTEGWDDKYPDVRDVYYEDPDYTQSRLKMNLSWGENYEWVIYGDRKTDFPIDKYIYEHPEEFKELFNKAKVKAML